MTLSQGARAAAIMKELPLSKVYQLLEPGPVVLLTTAGKGKSSVMVEFEPPLVACIVSNSFRLILTVLLANFRCDFTLLFMDWPVTLVPQYGFSVR